MKFKRYRPKKAKKRLYVFSIVVISILIVFLILHAKIEPTIRTLATSQASNLATIEINNTVDEILREDEVTYNDLVKVEHGPDGSVTSVKSDIVKINTLKAKISDKCAKEIASIQDRKLAIPVGSLVGSDLFSGRGPNVNLYVTLSGDVETQVKNKFESAGINQTIHRIYLEITSNVYVVLPGAHSSTKVKTVVCIAETVIVGKVPETYGTINGVSITQK